jgi:release factor glutamine methyltransferase
MAQQAPALAQAPTATPHLLRPPGVYAPQYDTRILTSALYREPIGPGTDVLDVGTGTGALALHAARRGARVTAVDISWAAVWTTRLNALLTRQRVTVRHRDLTTAVRGHTYDLVISNPPYVPSPSDGPRRRGRARAWDAGADGRALLDLICDTAPGSLRADGVLLLVQSALSGTDATLDRLTGAGLYAEVVDRARIPFGPVLRARAPWLRRRGLMGEENREELVVIRAARI